MSTHSSSATRTVPVYADEQLVADFNNGDHRAFETLVVRYQDRAYRFCLRFLGNRELAEEAAQEAFVRVYKKLHTFRGDSSFSSWFYRVLGNHCKNCLKASGRRMAGKHDSLDEPLAGGGQRHVEDKGPTPEGAVGLKERQLLVAQALSKLAEDDRTLLILREIEGQTYEDVGKVLGDLPLGTVKSRLYRARQALKEQVTKLVSAGNSN